MERQARPAPLELTYAPMHIVTNAMAAVIPRTKVADATRESSGERLRAVHPMLRRKTAMAESAAMSAIAVAQCRTTESGVIGQPDRCRAEENLNEEEHGDRAGDRRDERRTAPLCPRDGEERDDATAQPKRKQAMRPFPQRPVAQDGNKAPVTERPVRAGQPSAVDSRPAPEHRASSRRRNRQPAPSATDASCSSQRNRRSTRRGQRHLER